MDRFEKKAREIAEKLTEKELLGLLTTHQHEIKRFGLGEFYIGTEVARGYVGRDPEKVSTVFPQPIGLAGTFDRELMEKLGAVAGAEARAYYARDGKGGLMLWGPTIDMERDPRWGRTEEGYGEDPYLAGAMTAAYTKSMAGADKDGHYMTVPTLKHFCADNNEDDRIDCDAFLPPRLKHEYYYAPYVYAIKHGGARSVMAAYNSVNGIPAIMNSDINDVLKKKCGLWFAVSDGGDFTQSVTAHRYTESLAKAFALSVKAGCNIMTDSDEPVRAAAKLALKQGLITVEELRHSAAEVIKARLRLGQGSEESRYTCPAAQINSPESSAVNLRAAMEQVVLLKNDGTLPIRSKPKKIAVVGALADSNLRDWYTGYFTDAVTVFEGIKREFPDAQVVHDSLWDIYTITAPNGKLLRVHDDGTVCADGERGDGEAVLFEIQNWSDGVNDDSRVNLYSVKYKKYLRLSDDGSLKLHNSVIYDWFTRETFCMKKTASDNGCIFEDYQFHRRMRLDDKGRINFGRQYAATPDFLFGCTLYSAGSERAEKAAKDVDLVVWCVGNDPMQGARECFDRKTLSLPREMRINRGKYKDSADIRKKTVMVLISSFPYSINTEDEELPAILYTTHAGAHLGTAAAQTISGKNVPSGHLAMTWYRSELELPDIHEYDIEKAGTTYMYFRGRPLYPFGHGLSYAEFALGELRIDGGKASLDAENTSDTDGTAVMQLYFTVRNSAFSRPLRRLCGFERVPLRAGEKRRVSIDICADALAVYDTAVGRFITEDGEYEFCAGLSSADIRCTAVTHIDGEKPGIRAKRFCAVEFDSYDSIRICANVSTDKTAHRSYVRATGWVGTLVYKRTDLSGAKRITLRASLIVGSDELTVQAGGREYTAKVPHCDRYDDLRRVTVELTDPPCEPSELVIKLKEGMALSEITIE